MGIHEGIKTDNECVENINYFSRIGENKSLIKYIPNTASGSGCVLKILFHHTI